ncbi:hypothetical protein BCR32DRAFT_290213 [Anaeromyces robustus]|uniref:Uncharacterized protein n=1 Tax=Anaeromyces robustus TaxID=1754192 RepID=A0A1Y1XL80_9FUNG|nr:hypothetical protein BCR32DRAFT_290213 [Anaeromyces robustus]|eukprot:ORX86094.1 hypothetical protein BCR32DRAFT_290213 [Anaeromyces robustus]
MPLPTKVLLEKVTPFWKAAGVSYLEVLNISTRALQNSLKAEHLKFYLNREDGINIHRNNLNNGLPDDSNSKSGNN